MIPLKTTHSPSEAPPAIKILAVYLAVSSLAAVFAWATSQTGGVFVVAHAVALIAVGLLVVAGRSGALLDWLPLVAIPLLYAELPRIAIGQLRDPIVQRWEGMVFGASPAQMAAAHWPNALLSESLHATYLSYYAIIYGPPLLLYVRGQLPEFRRTVAGLMLMFAICYVIFIAFPVAGPRYEWTEPRLVFDGPVRRLVLRVLAAGSSRGTAFPSSHVAVATVQSVLAFRWSRRTGLLLCALTSCLAIAAVYGGFHYGVDVLAGSSLGLVIGLALVFADHGVLARRFAAVAVPIQGVDEPARGV
jgi:membrane-associated phospholipid phosphatase